MREIWQVAEQLGRRCVPARRVCRQSPRQHRQQSPRHGVGFRRDRGEGDGGEGSAEIRGPQGRVHRTAQRGGGTVAGQRCGGDVPDLPNGLGESVEVVGGGSRTSFRGPIAPSAAILGWGGSPGSDRPVCGGAGLGGSPLRSHRQPQVAQLPVSPHAQNVVGFDVGMDHAVVVQFRQGIEQLPPQLEHGVRREWARDPQPGAEGIGLVTGRLPGGGRAGEWVGQRHGVVHPTRGLPDMQNGEQVRVKAGAPAIGADALDLSFAPGLEPLDRDQSMIQQVAGQPDGAEPTASQHAQQLVVGEGRFGVVSGPREWAPVGVETVLAGGLGHWAEGHRAEGHGTEGNGWQLAADPVGQRGLLPDFGGVVGEPPAVFGGEIILVPRFPAEEDFPDDEAADRFFVGGVDSRADEQLFDQHAVATTPRFGLQVEQRLEGGDGHDA